MPPASGVKLMDLSTEQITWMYQAAYDVIRKWPRAGYEVDELVSEAVVKKGVDKITKKSGMFTFMWRIAYRIRRSRMRYVAALGRFQEKMKTFWYKDGSVLDQIDREAKCKDALNFLQNRHPVLRRIIQLKFWVGLTNEQIATVMKFKNESQVRYKLGVAYEILRKYFNDETN